MDYLVIKAGEKTETVTTLTDCVLELGLCSRQTFELILSDPKRLLHDDCLHFTSGEKF